MRHNQLTVIFILIAIMVSFSKMCTAADIAENKDGDAVSHSNVTRLVDRGEELASLTVEVNSQINIDYLVQPGDILEISVWKEKDLQNEVIVRPDGAFSFPLIGEIHAQNHTIGQLREEITKRISKYIPDADVTVAAKQLQGNKVYVIGKVNRPGEFPMNRKLDVVQALAIAGGMTQFANVDDIIVIRRSKNDQQVFKFDYNEVEKGRNLQQNIMLTSGDIVVVP